MIDNYYINFIFPKLKVQIVHRQSLLTILPFTTYFRTCSDLNFYILVNIYSSITIVHCKVFIKIMV